MSGTRYVDRAGPVGGQVFYRVIATSGHASSAPSELAGATVVPEAPPPTAANFVAASGPAPASLHDLVINSSASLMSSPALAGNKLQLAISGSLTTRVAQARVEVQAAGGAWQQVATLNTSESVTGWSALGSVATAALPAGAYLVRVVAVAANGAALETTAAAPLQVVHSAASPTGVSAQVQGDSVVVSWVAATSAVAVTYSVYRSQGAGTGYALAASGLSSTTYSDAFLPGASSVTYVVTATDAVGNQSGYSGPATLFTPAAWNIQGPSVSLQALRDAGAASMASAAVASHSGVTSVTFAYAPVGSGAWIDLPLALPLPTSVGGGPPGRPRRRCVGSALEHEQPLRLL